MIFKHCATATQWKQLLVMSTLDSSHHIYITLPSWNTFTRWGWQGFNLLFTILAKPSTGAMVIAFVVDSNSSTQYNIPFMLLSVTAVHFVTHASRVWLIFVDLSTSIQCDSSDEVDG